MIVYAVDSFIYTTVISIMVHTIIYNYISDNLSFLFMMISENYNMMKTSYIL